MYTENIIRSLEDLIHDVRQAGGRAYESKRDADRTFTYVREGNEGTVEAYGTVSDGLVDASEALYEASDDLGNIEERLKKIIEDIKMEELSAKVQSK